MSFDEVPVTPLPLPHQPPVLDRGAGDAGRSPVGSPRLGEYIDRMRRKVPPKMLRTYDSAWRVISQAWVTSVERADDQGDRRADVTRSSVNGRHGRPG
ncbi:hypothetical protein [Nocardia pneumoniae]|uniref:hypothetical protein n=1 Tax=Nocardia pneumoniae TaxID=228601 RepID=UPI0012F696C8|nr:hypothetical protein [Nocardia pneumoniae]